MTKPNWTPIKIRLGDIICWEHNPRMSNKAQAQRLIESEKRWGQPMSFAVSPLKDGKVELYDGHQRYSAWLTVYGADYEVDARQCDRHLTEEERLEFVVTMHAGATGSWDWQKLSSFPAPKLIEMGFDEALKKQYDFDANNIKELLNSEHEEPVDADPQIDRAAELQEKWQTASGQLWRLGDHRLLIGDCTVRENVERLMGGERANCVFIDPPYGMNFKGREFGKNGIENDGENFDEILKNSNGLFPIDNGVIVVWFSASRQDRMFLAMSGRNYHRSLFMYKPNRLAYTWHGWILTTEVCHLFSCGKPKWIEEHHHHDTYVFDYSERPDRNIDHPNVKPLSILEDIMGKIDGENIYDCFAGSGTTIIAAHNLNRRCYAMEISEKYGAVILERYFTATGITPELVTE